LPAFFLKNIKVREMVSEEIADRVRAMAGPILFDEGIELVDIEYRRESRGWVLRLYLDRTGGVTLDDCTRISQEVGRSLDVEDLIQTPYTLEVSSPGLTRRLRTEKDFMNHQGGLIKVRTIRPIDNRRQFKGKLLRVSENRIEIEIDGGVFQIPLSNVEKANLEFEGEVPRRVHAAK
jgi:ribosome maturation factor RimP